MTATRGAISVIAKFPRQYAHVHAVGDDAPRPGGLFGIEKLYKSIIRIRFTFISETVKAPLPSDKDAPRN